MPGAQAETLRPVVYSRRRRAGVAAEDWTSTWACVGFAEQLPRPGDLLPATVSGHALHVRRGEDGQLRAAFNARPFGGCMSIPLQCSGARKIRCPNAACAFSEDPDVVSPHDEEGARMLPQFVGFNPSRLVPVRLDTWGSLLFVNLSRAPVAPLHESIAALTAAMGPRAPLDLEAGTVVTQELCVGWRAGAALLAEALVARASGGDPAVAVSAPRAKAHPEEIGFTRLTATGGPRREHVTSFLVEPNLVLACLPQHVLAAVLRPVGPGACSLLGAVLRPRSASAFAVDQVVSWWRDVLTSLAR